MKALLAPLVSALVLHGCLLGGGAIVGGSEGSASAGPPVLSVRSVPAVARAVPAQPADEVIEAVAPAAMETSPAAKRPQAAAPATKRAHQARAQPRHAAPAPLPAEAPPAPEPATAAEAEELPSPVLVQATADASLDDAAAPSLIKTVAGASTADAEVRVPVYRTRMPPPATLHYELHRGFLSGSGDLLWKPNGDHYELRLEGRVAGISVITQVSSGDFDAHGIAPLRFTDQRLRRAPNAANFQRDKGKITYSGPQVEFPLVPGAQDRLSWMIQIGAVLNAQPELAAEGGRISFFVTGVRGDADVWTFRYVGNDTLRGEDGPVRAVKFTREPRRPYDSLVEVWLASEHDHVPVRARVSADSNNDVFELLLRGMHFP